MFDLDEQAAFLTRLTKSVDPVTAERAREALDRLATVDIEKVGPKGYTHGWVFVGAPGVGTRVHHQHLGHGTVTHHDDRNGVHVQFDSGIGHTFEHRPGGGPARLARHEGPISDKEFAARAKRVDQAMRDHKHLATDVTHKPDGEWTEDRARLHREIVDHLYAQASRVPNEGKAIIAGGLGGAGKTTTLRGHAGVDMSKYLNVNPDDIKDEMAARGMVPEVPGHPDLSPMERATLIHEESGDIAKMLAKKAYADRKNVIWDISMSSGGSVQKRVDDLRRSGYRDVHGVFVHIPVETSVERAMGRYRSGVNDYRSGKGFGGRYMPPSIMRARKAPDGDVLNRKVFHDLKPQFDHWSMYDNTGSAPVLVDKKGA